MGRTPRRADTYRVARRNAWRTYRKATKAQVSWADFNKAFARSKWA